MYSRSMEALREYLSLTGISQGELARRAGIDQGLISYYVTGKRRPSIRNLKKLMQVTNMKFEQITKGMQ